MRNGGRSALALAAMVTALGVLAAPATAAPVDDYDAIRADWGPDGRITSCAYTLEQLSNARQIAGQGSDTYTDFPAAIDREIGFYFSGGCPGTSGGTIVRPAVVYANMTARIFRARLLGTAIFAQRRPIVRPFGTTFLYRITQPGRATIVLHRALPGRLSRGLCRFPTRALLRARPCTRYLFAGALYRRAPVAGFKRVYFSGRVGRRPRLAPGVYRATITAFNASGVRSLPRFLRFVVVP